MFQQKRNLCEVWHNDICFLAELAHFCDKIHGESGVKFSEIAHNRIDHNFSIAAAELVEEIGDGLYLLSGTEISGVNAVKFQL